MKTEITSEQINELIKANDLEKLRILAAEEDGWRNDNGKTYGVDNLYLKEDGRGCPSC